jgi:hypothetical protein
MATFLFGVTRHTADPAVLSRLVAARDAGDLDTVVDELAADPEPFILPYLPGDPENLRTVRSRYLANLRRVFSDAQLHRFLAAELEGMAIMEVSGE